MLGGSTPLESGTTVAKKRPTGLSCEKNQPRIAAITMVMAGMTRQRRVLLMLMMDEG